MNVKISNEKARKAIMRSEAQRIVRDQINNSAKRYDTILACALHIKHDFGTKRILDFLKEIIDMHIYTKERYGEVYQDSSYAEMLRRDGIDMDEIERELDKYAAERGIVL